MHHDDAILILPGLLMGGLEAEEAGSVRAHVAGCDRCQEELARLDATVGELSALLPAVEPPPHLRAAVLAAVDEARAGEVPGRAAEPVPAPAVDAAPRRVPSLAARRHRRRELVTAVLAAACLALLVVAGSLVARLGDLEGRLADSERKLSAAATPPERGDDEGTVPGTTLVADSVRPLTTSGPVQAAHGRVVTVGKGDDALLLIQDLPEPAHGHAWQVWAIDGAGRKRSLDVMPHGSAVVLVPVRLGAGERRVVTVAMTHEPAGGSKQPTGVPVAHASV